MCFIPQQYKAAVVINFVTIQFGEWEFYEKMTNLMLLAVPAFLVFINMDFMLDWIISAWYISFDCFFNFASVWTFIFYPTF